MNKVPSPTATKTRAPLGEQKIATEAPVASPPAVVHPQAGRQALNSGYGGVAQERQLPAAKTYAPKMVKAILAVTGEIGAVQKQGFNSFHKYNYQKWEDILNVLSPLLVKHGLLITQSETERNLFESDQLMSITYIFTIVNDDGDVWPDPIRWTSVARARDQKMVPDDKAANKCHTQAQKYCYIQLFKIKTDDVEDSDSGADRKPSEGQKRPVPSPAGKVKPYAISTNGEKFPSWTEKFLAEVAKAETAAELTEWDTLNDETLSIINDKAPELYKQITAAFDKRGKELAPKAEAKADDMPMDYDKGAPQTDPSQEEEEPEPEEPVGAMLTEDEEANWLTALEEAYETVEVGAMEDFVDIQNKYMAPYRNRVSANGWKAAQIKTDKFKALVDPPKKARAPATTKTDK